MASKHGSTIHRTDIHGMNYRHSSRLAALGLLGVAALGVSACDDLLTESPPHVLVADNLFVDAAGFEAGLNGLYSRVRDERVGNHTGTTSGNNVRTHTWSLGTDVAWGNALHPDQFAFNRFGPHMNPEFRTVNFDWTWLYETVNVANTIISRAENPDVRWTVAQKDRTVAAARLIRAWAYRHLTYLFGPVPLNLEESSGTSIRTDWERAPLAEIRQQMEQDLLFAEQHLPATTPDASRVSSAVARHYLAELYLVMDRPADAEQKAEAVINSGDYALITERYGVKANEPGVPFMDMFQDGNVNRDQGNTEVLWALQYQQHVPGGGFNIMRRDWGVRYWRIPGLELSVEYGGRGIARAAPTSWLLDLYEPGDDRGSHHAMQLFYLYNTTRGLPAGKEIGDTVWLKWGQERENTWDWPSTRKWDWTDPSNTAIGNSYDDQPYLRLAETILLAAEAEMKQGKHAEAAAHINLLRRRANASEISPGQVTIDFILDERARELFSEEHRRYTLLRTGKWFERTQKYNPITGPNITQRDTIFPIPQPVIDANLDSPMPQNPGY